MGYQHYSTVIRHYNGLRNHYTYNSTKIRVGELAGDCYTEGAFTTAFIDASLECCGHPRFAGAVQKLYWLLQLFDDATLTSLAEEHLQNFATLEYVLVLKKGAK